MSNGTLPRKGLGRDPGLRPDTRSAVRGGSRPGVSHLQVGCVSSPATTRVAGNAVISHGVDCLCEDKVVYYARAGRKFQDKLLAEAKDCVLLPDGVTYITAAFIACGAGTSFQSPQAR